MSSLFLHVQSFETKQKPSFISPTILQIETSKVIEHEQNQRQPSLRSALWVLLLKGEMLIDVQLEGITFKYPAFYFICFKAMESNANLVPPLRR